MRLPGLFIFLLLTLLATPAKAHLDSLFKLFQQQSISPAQVDTANTWIYDYVHLDPQLALEMAQENLRRARKLEYGFGETESLARIGLGFDYLYELDSAYAYYLAAGRAHAKSRKFREAFSNIHNAGLTRYRAERFEEALDLYQEANALADSCAYEKGRALVMSNTGKVYNRMGLLTAAESAFRNSLKLREKLGDERGVVYCLETLVNLYFQMKEFTRARPYLEKGMAISEKMQDSVAVASFRSKQGRLLIEEGKYGQAIRTFEEILEFGKNLNVQDAQPAVSYYWIAFSYSQLENNTAAIRYGEQSLSILVKNKDHFYEQEVRVLLSEWYENAGQDEKALENLKIAYELEQKNRGEKVADLVAEEAVKYRLDSIRNAAETKTLIETEKRLSQERLAEERLQKVEAVQKNNSYLWGMLILVAIIVGLLGLFLWRNNRDRKQIQAQKQLLEASLEEKEVLMREIHHRVKNNLQSIASMLQMQKRRSKNAEVRETLGVSLVRISTLSKVHSILYQQHDLSQINGEEIIREVVAKVLAGFDARAEISIELKGFSLDQDQLLYLGFIVNEWLTNALKYSTSEHLQVKIFGEKDNGKNRRIVLWENGAGYDPDQINRGFGLNMMESMAIRMGGEFSYDTVPNKTYLSF